MQTNLVEKFLEVSGWLFGLVSLLIAYFQWRRADTALAAETRVRKLLHGREVIQSVLGLSDASMTLHALTSSASREVLRKEAVRVAADLNRALAFVNTSLPGDEKAKLMSAAQSLRSALNVITTGRNAALTQRDQQTVEQHCIEAALALHGIRGYLEQAEAMNSLE